MTIIYELACRINKERLEIDGNNRCFENPGCRPISNLCYPPRVDRSQPPEERF